MTTRVRLDEQKLLGFRMIKDANKRPLTAMIGSKGSVPPARAN